MYSLEILVLGRLFEISAWGGVLIGSRILDWGGYFSSYHSNRIKIERKGNAHEGTLLAHGDRNHRKEEETIILYWFLCKVVNKVAVETGFPWFLLFAKVREESRGGGLFKRGACLTLWPSKWVLIWGGGGGRVVLFTTWALICQAFSRAWSMSINSQSLVFSRKIDNRIRHLGWACEHNLNPPPGDLNSQS